MNLIHRIAGWANNVNVDLFLFFYLKTHKQFQKKKKKLGKLAMGLANGITI